ncbi:MAG: acyl-CoA thioesterase II [Gammaproteobacteria bacterium]|nr:acyl-CoA thioesterase II [Gammaproteobacteria bacterium]
MLESQGTPPETSAVAELLALFDLEPQSNDVFAGTSPQGAPDRLYGGQPLGQSLIAAAHTIDNEDDSEDARPPHSLHAYFLRWGSNQLPIFYEVERLRDGRSFSARRVVAKQADKPIFVCTLSFHRPEVGYDHQTEMPKMAGPEGLPSFAELRAHEPGDDHPMRGIEMRPVAGRAYFSDGADAPPHLWMRSLGNVPDDPILHQAIIAYMSDSTLLSESLRPHDLNWHDPRVQTASLDHALWFHRGARIDDWLLYIQDSPSAANGRGFCRGSLYARDGAQVASVAQEGLVRKVEAS